MPSVRIYDEDDDQSKLDWYLSFSYDISIRHVAGEFLLALPDLSLIARGRNLGLAFDEIESRKRDYFMAMIEMGREKEIRLPSDYTSHKSLVRSILPFSIKTAIAVLAIVFGTLSLATVAEVKLKDLRKIARNVGRDIPRGLEEGFSELREMPPEKREKVLKSVRNYLDSIAPIVHEAQRALQLPETQEPPKEN